MAAAPHSFLRCRHQTTHDDHKQQVSQRLSLSGSAIAIQELGHDHNSGVTPQLTPSPSARGIGGLHILIQSSEDEEEEAARKARKWDAVARKESAATKNVRNSRIDEETLVAAVVAADEGRVVTEAFSSGEEDLPAVALEATAGDGDEPRGHHAADAAVVPVVLASVEVPVAATEQSSGATGRELIDREGADEAPEAEGVPSSERNSCGETCPPVGEHGDSMRDDGAGMEAGGSLTHIVVVEEGGDPSLHEREEKSSPYSEEGVDSTSGRQLCRREHSERGPPVLGGCDDGKRCEQLEEATVEDPARIALGGVEPGRESPSREDDDDEWNGADISPERNIGVERQQEDAALVLFDEGSVDNFRSLMPPPIEIGSLVDIRRLSILEAPVSWISPASTWSTSSVATPRTAVTPATARAVTDADGGWGREQGWQGARREEGRLGEGLATAVGEWCVRQAEAEYDQQQHRDAVDAGSSLGAAVASAEAAAAAATAASAAASAASAVAAAAAHSANVAAISVTFNDDKTDYSFDAGEEEEEKDVGWEGDTEGQEKEVGGDSYVYTLGEDEDDEDEQNAARARHLGGLCGGAMRSVVVPKRPCIPRLSLPPSPLVRPQSFPYARRRSSFDAEPGQSGWTPTADEQMTWPRGWTIRGAHSAGELLPVRGGGRRLQPRPVTVFVSYNTTFKRKWTFLAKVERASIHLSFTCVPLPVCACSFLSDRSSFFSFFISQRHAKSCA